MVCIGNHQPMLAAAEESPHKLLRNRTDRGYSCLPRSCRRTRAIRVERPYLVITEDPAHIAARQDFPVAFLSNLESRDRRRMLILIPIFSLKRRKKGTAGIGVLANLDG